MKCNTAEPLLSELINGTLSGKELWEVQAHVSACEKCDVTANELRSVSQMLRVSPKLAVSANFTDRVMNTLAEPALPPRKKFFLTASRRKMIFAPSLALGLATAAAAVFMFTAPKQPVQTPNVNDGALVHTCVQLHQNDVETQPLSDWSAHNLSNQLDAQAPAASAQDDENI